VVSCLPFVVGAAGDGRVLSGGLTGVSGVVGGQALCVGGVRCSQGLLFSIPDFPGDAGGCRVLSFCSCFHCGGATWTTASA